MAKKKNILNILNKILARSRSSSGETITEVLVSVLIAAMAVLILANAISSSSRILKKSNDAMDDYYADNNELVQNNSSDAQGTVKITLDGYNVAITPDRSDTGVNVDYYVNNFSEGVKVISYDISD